MGYKFVQKFSNQVVYSKRYFMIIILDRWFPMLYKLSVNILSNHLFYIYTCSKNISFFFCYFIQILC